MNYTQCPQCGAGFGRPLSDCCPECGVELFESDPDQEPVADAGVGMVMNERPEVTRARVIAEWEPKDGRWLVLWPDGEVTSEGDATQVLLKVRRQRRRATRARGIDVTTLEWRNVPSGFDPPEGEVQP